LMAPSQMEPSQPHFLPGQALFVEAITLIRISDIIPIAAILLKRRYMHALSSNPTVLNLATQLPQLI
ncbi:hypothetical protein ACQ1Z1_14100, partial [Enterococcus faecalis]|uniref:hypothetical protein n=1 Tax=Enterococcus faecalis TaxID=1351 RepID=UPI003D6B4D66